MQMIFETVSGTLCKSQVHPTTVTGSFLDISGRLWIQYGEQALKKALSEVT